MSCRLSNFVTLLSLSLFAVGGCQGNSPQSAPVDLPVVPVSQPVQREVTEYAEFTGRTNAVQSVDVRARVSGYLMKMPFKEGDEVKEGDLLFEVDPRPYQAQYNQAEAQVNLYKAQLGLTQANYDRDLEIAKMPGAVSAMQLDQDKAAVAEADAAVKAFQASLESYKLNLDFTKVASPISGLVSRYYLTLGNLVVQDQTLLTTVVSLDPMYVYFDMDEGTLIRIRSAVNDGSLTPYEEGTVPVFMALQGETGYPHKGTVTFINNQVNSGTGSITVRGVFKNAKPKDGVRLLSPGMFVRVQLPLGRPHQAVLVVDRAVGTDQGMKFVYVVDSENKVQYRRVKTGAIQEDGLRVITDGLQPDDLVVVGGLQQIRPLAQVKMERVSMTSIVQSESAATQASKNDAPSQSNGVKSK